MSTNIAIIRGDKEIPIPSIRDSRYEKVDMYITRFWGGKRGMMLQFTIEDSHIQLDADSITYLKLVLSDWENANELDK